MEKTKFTAYCESVGTMIKNVPDFADRSSSIVADYIRESVNYGFGQALKDLTQTAYAVVKEWAEKSGGAETDLYELASAASVLNVGSDYRFNAYYFAVCVVAVALGEADIDDIDCDMFDENELKFFDSTVSVGEEPDPQKKQLKKFGVRLLDFSRSNPLVHFRATKKSTLSLYSNDIPRTIALVAGKKRIYFSTWKKLKPEVIYKCKICGGYAFGKYDFSAKKSQPAEKCPVCDAENTRGRKSMLPLNEKLGFISGGIACACGETIPVKNLQGGGVCPKCGKKVEIKSFPLASRSALTAYAEDEVVCGTGDNDSKEIVKTLINRAKNMERNFGLHVLYLACGFLKWKDTNGTEYNSPILLCPVNMFIDRGAGTYYFEANQTASGYFEVNKTLLHMLRAYSASCSIKLPELDEGNPQAYFARLKASFKAANESVRTITADWEIKTEMGIGLFHYQKLQLEHDISENSEKYLRHPIIRRLCGDAECGVLPSKQISSSLRYMLLDADSSQEEVIRASQEGKSFILQGPPGSGKSQTITNIISVAAGDGKSVLFVTEKASARSVILDNLSRCRVDGTHNLSNFVLDFDCFSKRGGAIGREPFITELNNCLAPYTPAGGYDDDTLAMESYLRGQIKDFMDMMRGDYGGKSCLRLLQDSAEYAEYEVLENAGCIPADRVEFTKLCDLIGKYYIFVKNGAVKLDYRTDKLYGCKGDYDGGLLRAASGYIQTAEEINNILSELNALGFNTQLNKSELTRALHALDAWGQTPPLTRQILNGLSLGRVISLIKSASERKELLHRLNVHVGKAYEGEINAEALKNVDLAALIEAKNKYAPFIKRAGSGYKQFLSSVFGCFDSPQGKLRYKTAVAALEKLRAYDDYVYTKSEYEKSALGDFCSFGLVLKTEEDCTELLKKLEAAKRVYESDADGVIDKSAYGAWLAGFEPASYPSRIAELRRLYGELSSALEREEKLSSALSDYFTRKPLGNGYPAHLDTAELICGEKHRLADWYRVCGIVNTLSSDYRLPVLHELISKDTEDYDRAKGCLYKSYYKKIIDAFINANGLAPVKDFNRTAHEKLIQSYAETDKKALASGAARLYEYLSAQLKAAGSALQRNSTGGLPKLQSKSGFSIKRTILENWDYIKRIKPCFMMSPLNVSQYVDIGIEFDLVIFDEASQIFTEDALASIVRGKQVIIAGDSKQLPPCDFFRAGDVSQDLDDRYFEDEANKDNSLLVAADEALSDASISLCWHYRSCDEALIAFSNKSMEYNLITFPSAVKNPNDGIMYVPVKYNPATCYEAGKNASHVNSGEAEKIVEILWSELTNPEREKFSLGVVAFSNAQALEIENRWEAFKQKPDKKPVIEAWEQRHVNEPIIFCNLDTMQGDERDTMIISVCYSPDSDGKFVLPYLGRIRLPSGKKRINVAITRSRHQMIVVSTLDYLTLKVAADNSSAPEENKEGARMLCDFLKYAESFVSENKVVSSPSQNPFVNSVCRVLGAAGIEYDTEIGRSECKVNIGIRKKGESDSFALGIIIDDPRRPDFDSPREYARLTKQVLCGKYNWKTYRIFPVSWVNDYENEKRLLLETVSRALE